MEVRTQDGRKFIQPDDFENNDTMRTLIDCGAIVIPDDQPKGFRIGNLADEARFADRLERGE